MNQLLLKKYRTHLQRIKPKSQIPMTIMKIRKIKFKINRTIKIRAKHPNNQLML